MGNSAVRFQSIAYKDTQGNNIAHAQCGAPLRICFTMEANPTHIISQLSIAVGVDDEHGIRITHLSNSSTNQVFEQVNKNQFVIEINIPILPLKGGNYTLTLFASVNGDVADWIQEAAMLSVESGDFFSTGKLPEDSQGSFYINHSFTIS
jgi:lipopolysaccharide transport system ATP-binding protein